MSALIYWLAIRLYAIAVRIAALFKPKARLFVKGRKGLLSQIKYALVNERRPRIWMHCASLGEFEQGRPVLEKLRRQYPNYAFVLTFFSPSGYEVRKDYAGADYVFYLPLDSYYNARRFLASVQPKLVLFVKYELWYFFLSLTARRDIPLLLISAVFRKDQPFFKWYGRLHRRMLRCFTQIFVQDEASGMLLQKIGIENWAVGGDTRFDRVIEAVAKVQPLPTAASFSKNNKIIVAGSTWKEDELFLKEAIDRLPANWKLILVPHEVHKSHIEAIVSMFGDEAVLWSVNEDVHTKRVLVVDTVGLLSGLYQYADVAWIGGGFGKDGVHNVLEAAVYGKPVSHGPVYSQYIEARELLAANASFVPASAEAFVKQLLYWEKDAHSYEQSCAAAKEFVQSHAGATRKVLDYLEAKKLLSTP